MRFENYNLVDVVTPINVKQFKELLQETAYPEDKAQFLVDGFTNGFDIGYEGPVIRQDKVDYIPLHIGNKIILWNKIMKEVKLCRYAGPFAQIPFDNYMQSRIGLLEFCW